MCGRWFPVPPGSFYDTQTQKQEYKYPSCLQFLFSVQSNMCVTEKMKAEKIQFCKCHFLEALASQIGLPSYTLRMWKLITNNITSNMSTNDGILISQWAWSVVKHCYDLSVIKIALWITCLRRCIGQPKCRQLLVVNNDNNAAQL